MGPENSEQMQQIMYVIMHSGNAKSEAMEAIQLAKTGEIIKARAQIHQAQTTLSKAHQAQTSLLSAEAGGEKVELDLLTIHSQDHVMTTITFIELAKEVIELYQRIEGQPS